MQTPFRKALGLESDPQPSCYEATGPTWSTHSHEQNFSMCNSVWRIWSIHLHIQQFYGRQVSAGKRHVHSQQSLRKALQFISSIEDVCLTIGGTSLPQLVTLSLFMGTLPRRCKIMSCRLPNEIVESTCRHPDIFKMHLLKMHLLFSDSDKNSSSYWCMRNNGLRPPHELLEAPTDGSGGRE